MTSDSKHLRKLWYLIMLLAGACLIYDLALYAYDSQVATLVTDVLTIASFSLGLWWKTLFSLSPFTSNVCGRAARHTGSFFLMGLWVVNATMYSQAERGIGPAMAAVASLNICLIIMEAVSTILVFKGQEKASDNGAATADNKKSITDYVKDGGRDCGPISMGAATTVNQRQLSVETGVVQPLGLNGAVVYDMEQYHKEYQLYLKSQQLSTSDQATGAEASEGMEGKYDDPLQESSYKIEAPMDGPHEGSSSAVPPRPTIEGHFPHTPSIPPHLEVEPFTPSMKGHTQPPAIPLSGSSDLVHPILAIPAQQTSPTPSIDVRGLLPVDVQLRANP